MVAITLVTTHAEQRLSLLMKTSAAVCTSLSSNFSLTYFACEKNINTKFRSRSIFLPAEEAVNTRTQSVRRERMFSVGIHTKKLVLLMLSAIFAFSFPIVELRSGRKSQKNSFRALLLKFFKFKQFAKQNTSFMIFLCIFAREIYTFSFNSHRLLRDFR